MKIQICRASNGSVVHEEEVVASTNGFIEFDETLTLLPNTEYEIRINVEYT